MVDQSCSFFARSVDTTSTVWESSICHPSCHSPSTTRMISAGGNFSSNIYLNQIPLPNIKKRITSSRKCRMHIWFVYNIMVPEGACVMCDKLGVLSKKVAYTRPIFQLGRWAIIQQYRLLTIAESSLTLFEFCCISFACELHKSTCVEIHRGKAFCSGNSFALFSSIHIYASQRVRLITHYELKIQASIFFPRSTCH